MGKLQRALTLFLMAGFGLVLSGCGGDDVFLTPPEGPGGGADPKASSVASVILLASTPTLGSASDSEVDLTVLVKDANNAMMEGETVVFSSSGGGVQGNPGTTNSAGIATAKLFASGDPTNRNLTVSASVGNISDSIVVAVTGSIVSISGESSVVLGNSIDLTVFLKDSAGNAVSGKEVSVSSAKGNTLSSNSLVTGISGNATVSLTGVVPGVDTITVSGLGEVATYTVSVSPDQFSVSLPAGDLDISAPHTVAVEWQQNGNPVPDGQTVAFSTTRGTLSSPTAATSAGLASVTLTSDTIGPVEVTAVTSSATASVVSEFVATIPASINLQAASATIGPDGQEARLTAIVRDINNNVVKDVVIRFSIEKDTSGGSISNATDRTDSQGSASTVYTSTSATTAKDGVVIKAEVESNPALTDSVAITVAQSELFVRLGTSHLMSALDVTRYEKPYTVLVADAAGNAVANVDVVVTLIPTYYWKGIRVPSLNPDTGEAEAPWVADHSAGCKNEDNLVSETALNGQLDPDEDESKDGLLTPGNVAVVQAVDGKVTTDDTGFAEIKIMYAKNYASWTRFKLRASAQVSGTEGFDEAEFTLPVLLADVNSLESTPPGAVSPFGSSNTCGNPD
ncbi:MAG TPA: hypothetical protein ENI94_05765 [Gammaproteobacteria bacterium]|nr:hypothetical protein [Gammaproteobacteria bacterium]